MGNYDWTFFLLLKIADGTKSPQQTHLNNSKKYTEYNTCQPRLRRQVLNSHLELVVCDMLLGNQLVPSKISIVGLLVI